MRRTLVMAFLVATLSVPLAPLACAQRPVPARAVDRIEREARHRILMLPYYNVFDDIKLKVEGYNVTLMGAVTRPTLKSEAENVVKDIEGVQKIENKIEVLPLSRTDDELRLKLFHAIYGYPPLQKYDLSVQKAIRIIVKNGNVTLEGVVDSKGDKNLVNIRAKSVPGIFSVTNNLKVVKS